MPLYDLECSACGAVYGVMSSPQNIALECMHCKTRLVDGVPCVRVLISKPAKHRWGCSSDGAEPSKGR